jgi:hypothetical protein
MPAEAQSAQTQTAKAQRNAASPEQLAADHAQKVEALLRTRQQMSEESRRNGLTEEILASILAEE